MKTVKKSHIKSNSKIIRLKQVDSAYIPTFFLIHFVFSTSAQLE